MNFVAFVEEGPRQEICIGNSESVIIHHTFDVKKVFSPKQQYIYYIHSEVQDNPCTLQKYFHSNYIKCKKNILSFLKLKQVFDTEGFLCPQVRLLTYGSREKCVVCKHQENPSASVCAKGLVMHMLNEYDLLSAKERSIISSLYGF